MSVSNTTALLSETGSEIIVHHCICGILISDKNI